LTWTSLAQNDQLAIYGELFNDESYYGKWRQAGCSPSTIACAPIRNGQSGAAYLDEVLSRFMYSRFAAVGFKLLYDQSRHNRKALQLWSYLERRTDARIIHLSRANLLEGFISLKVALATDRWFECSAHEPATAPIELSPEECWANFRDVIRARREIYRRFRNHALLEVEYEKDLVGKYDLTMERIQSFLGLVPCPVAPVILKQARAPLSRRLANYAELRRAFAGTRFASFFREPLDAEEAR
jgi:hypothetical protein